MHKLLYFCDDFNATDRVFAVHFTKIVSSSFIVFALSVLRYSAPPYGTGQLRLLSYPIWHWWVCTNMTWDAPAHDIFGFKMTSRQRGAQQAGRPSVWKKRSSRRRTSLLSSLMISPFSPTPLKQLSTSRILLQRVALFLFGLHQFIYLFLLCLTPSAPLNTSRDVNR